MEEQERGTDRLASGAPDAANGTSHHEETSNSAETQLGPAAPPSMGKITRQFSTTAATPAHDRRAETRAFQAAARERINTLVAALGDPGNPLHLGAVDDLVAIGPAAVPMLNEALNPNHPWLTAYRAAEALGQIGDGRAAGPLLDALRHPNSNVRWSAVRALAVVGDARALLELRRVARDDRGKTSWGEPVAGAAQSALNQMQSQNMLLQGADLIKTAVACVLMLVALIIAWKVVGDLRTELKQIGLGPVDASVLAPPAASPASEPTPAAGTPEAGAPAAAEAAPTPEPAVAATTEITGTVRATGNVRAQPQVGRNNVIGGVTEGDEVFFLASTPDGQWFRIRLGERHASTSRINGDTDNGWVNRSLLSPPSGTVPVEEPTAAPQSESQPEPTAAP